MIETTANVIITAGIIIMLFGIIGLFRFEDFYSRILVAGKIDTVGAITLMIGLMVRHGLSFFSLKLLLVIILMLILNPLASHTIARSAYVSDSALKDEYDDGQGGV